MRKLIATTLLTSTILLGAPQAGFSATGLMTPRAASLNDSGVSISYPTKVRLTSRDCGEFEIKYTLKNKSTVAVIRLFDASGKKIGGYGIDPSQPKGTAYIEYCKFKWENKRGAVYSGFKGGMVTLELDVNYGDSVSKGRFQVTK